MGTMLYLCGCFISRSMFGNREVVMVGVCFKHSLEDEVHAAQKALGAVTGGVETPENWQDPEVQEALVALAHVVWAIEREE